VRQIQRAANPMASLSWVLLVIVGEIVAQPPNPRGSPPERDRRSDLMNQFLTQQLEAGFSGIVLAVDGDQVILKQGYGLANQENYLPFSEEMVFTVGSITKQFTGAAIMKLVEQGKLRINDTVDRFFEDLPRNKQRIMIHHLLTHTAGLPGGFGDDFDTTATREWIVERFRQRPMRRGPGEKYAYSNVGYSLLGIIIEQVSGQSYEAYLREQLFLPSGMRDTGYVLPRFDPERLAVGYRDGHRWGTVLERPMLADGPSWNLRGNGGIHCTVDDILRWHRALRANKVLSKESKQVYLAPHVDEGDGDSFYGYGWVNWRTDWGTRMLSHDGGNGVFAADFHRYIEDDAMIFVATNADVKAWDLMPRLEAILFDRPQIR